MEILEAIRSDFVTADLPPDVRHVIDFLGATKPAGAMVQRRQTDRTPRHMRASVEIEDELQQSRQTVYTRDVSSWGVGFVSRMPLPVGAHAVMHIAGVSGEPMELRCCVLRCREVLPGWFEGAALFFREEPALAPPKSHGLAG